MFVNSRESHSLPSSTDALVQRHPRACLNCATAKAKFVSQKSASSSNSSIRCERCSRMELQCTAQTPILRKRREAKAVRVGQLEQKLDNIVNLLSQRQPAIPTLAVQPTSLGSASQTLNPSVASSKDSGKPVHLRSIFPSPPRSYGGSLASFPHQFTEANNLPDLGLTRREEAIRLRVFRERMIQYCPFVIIPSGISTQTLCQQEPFLFSTIMLAAANRGISYQKSIGRKLMEYMSVHLILNGEKSLDLLEGILVLITWCNNRHQNNPQISYLIQLAMSLVAELGINKSPLPENSTQSYLIEGTDTALCEGPQVPSFHPSDAMRAFLGCYYLSSVISSSFKKVDSMASSAYLDKCCNTLQEADEYPTDQRLVHLVKLQGCVRKILQLLPTESLEATWDSSTPIIMFVNTLINDIQKLRDELPTDLSLDPSLRSHYYRVEIFLYEISLSDSPQTTKESIFPRIKILYSCLNSAQSFLDSFFSILPEQYPYLTFVTWAQLSNVLVVIERLHLIKLEGWDVSYVQSATNFPAVLERLAHSFEAAGKQGKMRRKKTTSSSFQE